MVPIKRFVYSTIKFPHICALNDNFEISEIVPVNSITQESHEPILIIYDASGSMWGQLEGSTKKAIGARVLTEFMNSLPAEQPVGLMAYGHRKEKDCDDIEMLVGLDNVSKEKINGIDVIKIDTEGTEIDILKSGIDIIKTFEPIIICETLFNTIEDDLEHFFNSLNYQFYNHTPKGLVKVNSIRRALDNGIRNCFFVPKSRLHLITKFIIKD